MSPRPITYGSYRSIQDVSKKHQIVIIYDQFLRPSPVVVNENFANELTYVLEEIDVRVSEAAISEFLIAPILKEAWKPYKDYILIWSHVPLNVDGEFEGYPDYLFSKRTPLGLVRDIPYVLVVETKKDDFEAGWGQCLAEMLAAQTLNADPTIILQGIVTNGSGWQFGKLDAKQFTQDPRLFTIADLSMLFGALHDVFEAAKQQIIQPALG